MHHIAQPYSKLASAYDLTLGGRFFTGARRAFEALVKQYGIAFRSAADLGCGTGLFARYLGRRWAVPVFAVDRSPEMLEVAFRNCQDWNVRFLQQDIRCLHLPCKVDLVTANFDTLNHLLNGNDIRVTFHRIFQNLRRGGHFIFDMITPCQPMMMGVTYIRHLPTFRSSVQQRLRWNPLSRILSILVVLRAMGSLLPTIELHRERAYWPAEIASGLLDAGFVIRGVHDAQSLKVPSRCPRRIIVVAAKPV